ncbi:MAG: HAMP domain-containing protein [Deltaproteobacteria bacterium]|nr:MAG: HAMP domain-containing protein [Deltaproteobacteria bacterium]
MKALFGLRSKILLMTLGILVVTIGALTYLAYLVIYNEQEKEIGIRLQAIAATGALMIDGDLHDSIRKPEDAKTEAFLKLRKVLRKIKAQNELDTEVYTFRKDDNRLRFIVMTNPKPFVGDTYQIKPEMRPTLDEGKPSYTQIFGDQHGAWISAYAPIRDSKGKVVGILDVDYKLSTFMRELGYKLRWIFISSAVLFLLAIWISVSVSGRIVSNLKKLKNAAEEYSTGNMDVDIHIKSWDEVGDLAESMERMRESLRIAMAMLEEEQAEPPNPYSNPPGPGSMYGG